MTDQITDAIEGAASLVHYAELHESPDNPRTITDERFAALKHALKTQPDMMLARPVIADVTRGGEVVGGNMRLRAVSELIAEGDNGYTRRFGEMIPAFLHEFKSDAERREWMLRDNAGYGSWEDEALAALVREHETDGADMSLLGFGTDDLDRLLKESTRGDGGDGGGNDAPDMNLWGVIVECADEDSQAALLERLTEEGYTVRALL